MHLDAETTQRFVDEELSGGRHAAVLEHLEACETCRNDVEAARRLDARAMALIGSMAVPDPGVSVADIQRQAARPSGTGWRRWAAAAVLTVAGATAAYAAYRAPGGPLEHVDDPPATSDRPSAPQHETLEGASGITVDGARSIHIQDLGPGGELSVALHDGAGISIRSSRPGTAFDAEVERVTVRWDSREASRIAVEVPRSSSSVEVVVGSRMVWTWSGGRVTTVMESVDDGVYRLLGGS